MSGKATHQANNELQYLEYVAVGLVAALQKKFVLNFLLSVLFRNLLQAM